MKEEFIPASADQNYPGLLLRAEAITELYIGPGNRVIAVMSNGRDHYVTDEFQTYEQAIAARNKLTRSI